jgi:release factor glutamine methyltransferase
MESKVQAKVQLKDIIQKTTAFLRDKGSPSARLDTELLISAALQWERIKLYLNYEYPLTEEELGKCRDFVRRRASGEPVAYILGKKDFYNHSFKVSPAVLIPRPETETLVEEAIAFARQQMPEAGVIRVIDLGAGSGCIGLSVLAEVPQALLLAVDVSPEAVDVAKENASSVGVESRAIFHVGDASKMPANLVAETLGGPADILLANPPYIDAGDPLVEANVKKFEPTGALFSEDGGLRHIREWAERCADLVRPGALVMFEIGHDQGQSALGIFEATESFQNVRIVKDLSDQDRFIRAVRAQEN